MSHRVLGDQFSDEHATSGHCHSLAAAVHRATGWPIWGAYKVSDDPDENDRLVHVAVEHPDGDLIDADGKASVRSREQESGMWGNDPWEYERLGDESALIGAVADDHKSVWRPMDADGAEASARRLVRKFR